MLISKSLHTIPFILQSKCPNLIPIVEVSLLTKTLDWLTRIKFVILVGKIGKLYLSTKLLENVSFWHQYQVKAYD